MTILITNQITGHTTMHNSLELAREARHHAKKKGKYIGFHVSIQDGAPCGATVALVAEYQQPDGWRGQVNIAI